METAIAALGVSKQMAESIESDWISSYLVGDIDANSHEVSKQLGMTFNPIGSQHRRLLLETLYRLSFGGVTADSSRFSELKRRTSHWLFFAKVQRKRLCGLA
ncbi:hypothetical protein JOM56_014697 [Amanita muscaria]